MRWAWVVMSALAMGVAAYVNTRGSDGSLLGTIVWFGLIAGVHWTVRLVWLPHTSGRDALLELLACGLAVVVALAVKPELQEMGGLLNYLIPVLACVIVTTSYVINMNKKLLLS